MNQVYKNICSLSHFSRSYRRIGHFIIQTRPLCSKDGPVTEAVIIKNLKDKFPEASLINVEDTSGGCGAMFNVAIETKEFKGLSVMKQHRIVYEALKDEIKKIHGLHLQTNAPK